MWRAICRRAGNRARWYAPTANREPAGEESPVSGPFSVALTNLYPLPGGKFVVQPNGARISFTAPSVPTNANPAVACTVEAGAPLLVTWNYSPNSPFGYYTIQFADRSQMITTLLQNAIEAPLFNGNSAISCVYQLGTLVDPCGNTLNFGYSSPSAYGFPLLYAINDSGATRCSASRAHPTVAETSRRLRIVTAAASTTRRRLITPSGLLPAFQPP